MVKQSLKQNLLKFTAAFVASFVFAIACYDILLFFGIKPFANLYRMYAYHFAYYWQFIFIMCFVFSILAVLFSKKFKAVSLKKQILLNPPKCPDRKVGDGVSPASFFPIEK